MQLEEAKEQEDMCFMSDRIYLNYDDIVKEESVVVDYLAKNSDRFSVTAVIKDLIHNCLSILIMVYNYNRL